MQECKLALFRICLGISVISSGCVEKEEAPILKQSQSIVKEGPIAEETPALIDIPYAHPMSNSLVNGQLPFFEINEFANGKAIAIGDEVVSSGQEEFHFSGAVGMKTGFEVPLKKFTDDELISPTKISGGLNKWLMGNFAESIDVKVYIERPLGFETIFHRFEKEIARGEVLTFQDKDDAYRRALIAHQAVVSSQLLRLEGLVESVGGIVVSKRVNLFSLQAKLTKAQILILANRSEITTLDITNLPTEEGVDGSDVVEGTQLFQYLDTTNYYNADPFGIPIRFGIQEWKPINDTHPTFLDWNSSSSSRIKKLWQCSSGTCTSVSSFGTFSQDNHPTMVSGVALGDLMDGQDSSVTTFGAREERSGYSREADFYYYYGVGGSQFDTTIDRAISDNLAIWSTSGGYGSTVNDTNCLGETSGAKDLNSLYDSGTIPFILAGNYGHSSVSDCRVSHPAAAISAFVVGGHSQPALPDVDDVRVGNIAGSSSRGGGVSEGKRRTIIDITGPNCRTLIPVKYSSYSSATAGICGTSIATPTVSGAAGGYLEFYKETLSNAIDDPGLLTVNLLLFGDREGSTGSSPFSNLYGSGRLKMRYPVSSWMDGPWGWGSYETCISNHETFYHTLNNGQKISSDVEPIKAVMFFYDKQHELGITMDDVDLSLQRSSDNVTWTTIDSDTSVDEKSRVYYDNVFGSYYWRIKIYGYRVTSDDTGCGVNKIRTYYSWFYEDSDRDDSDGPGAEVDTE